MLKRFLSLSIPFVLLLSCSEEPTESKNTFSPRIFGITVSDMDKSMDWYTNNLHFERDTVVRYESSGITIGMMHLGDFYIELVGFEGSISKSELKLPNANSNLHGFFKIGFQSENINTLYQEMVTNQVDILAPLDHLPEIENREWPDEYFIATDPDGNLIQFFSKTKNTIFDVALKPFLVAISTPDINASIDWYKTHIEAVQFSEKAGGLGNERVLMEKDGLILELGQFADDRSFASLSPPEGVWRSKVYGVSKLSFLVKDIRSLYDQMKTSEIPFAFDLTETNAMTGDRYYMIQDNFGSSLQFLEVDQ